MRVLVTGSNGFLGQWLVRRLVERGDTVRALVRATSDASAVHPDAEQVTGDVCDLASLERAIEGCDVVFHLAGMRRGSSLQEFMEVNAGGTRKVCEAAATLETPPRVVLAGSLAATGPAHSGRPVREDDPFRPFEWYGESKAAAEGVLREFDGKVPWTVARPSRIVGPGDRENLTFFKLVAKGMRLTIGGPPCPISFVDVDDVVDGCLLLAESDAALGEAFFLAGETAFTLPEVQDRVAEHLGVSMRNVYLPRAVLWTLATAADGVTKLSGKRLPLNRKLARQLTAPGWVCSIDKARETLGYAPRVEVEQSLKRSADWYRAQGLI